MNNSGDAAEQIVRLSLEGAEVVLRLTGSAAKNIAAGIYAIAQNKDKTKTKGKQRLTGMLKSGKELKVFTLKEENLKKFASEAKRYGVVYCALRGKKPTKDGMVDIMVRAEDASKINRIVERFNLSSVDAATIKSEIQQSRNKQGTAPAEPEQAQPEKSEEDRLLDEMLGAPIQKEVQENPSAARTNPSPPSEPTSKQPSKAAEGTAKTGDDRPSVRKELREIKARRKQAEHTAPAKEPVRPQKRPTKSPQHQQPKRKKSPKER